MTTLFPHQKLDWSISKLEDRLAALDDPDAAGSARLELARAIVSRALYHKGGERDANRALQLARKSLADDPGMAEALVIASLALVAIERPDAAAKYADQAVRAAPDRADARLAIGWVAMQHQDMGIAVRQLEVACRLAPEAWETHNALARALTALGRQQDGSDKTASVRLLERSQYHLVRTLEHGPPPDQSASLFKDMGLACVATGRLQDAKKFFIRLREHDKYADVARYHLGRVDYEMGKYHNAIQHWRQYLRAHDNDADVLSRTAMAYFQLGDFARAREACHKALLSDPDHRQARHALGCTLLEEGQTAEAIKVFRDTLKVHPDDMTTYVELARTRRMGGDVGWLVRALEVETGHFDRLPPAARSTPER